MVVPDELAVVCEVSDPLLALPVDETLEDNEVVSDSDEKGMLVTVTVTSSVLVVVVDDAAILELDDEVEGVLTKVLVLNDDVDDDVDVIADDDADVLDVAGGTVKAVDDPLALVDTSDFVVVVLTDVDGDTEDAVRLDSTTLVVDDVDDASDEDGGRLDLVLALELAILEVVEASVSCGCVL
ncbi:hypothetical protein EMMF5_005055 [Cystobasidiomycetes sp. EMM_F5]